MLPGAVWMIGQCKEKMMKIYQSLFDSEGGLRDSKGILHRIEVSIDRTKRSNKIQCVRAVERSVSKRLKALEVSRPMVHYELMRIVLHPQHQFRALTNDGNTLTPCQHRCKKSRNLHILLSGKAVRYAYRIVFDKGRAVEVIRLFVQKRFQVGKLLSGKAHFQITENFPNLLGLTL